MWNGSDRREEKMSSLVSSSLYQVPKQVLLSEDVLYRAGSAGGFQEIGGPKLLF